MSDNKTLADAQPGGRVRLGDQLPPMPCTHYNAFGDGSEPLYTAEQMRDYARAALSAQPSPGETLPPDMRLGSADYLDYLDSKPSPGGQGDGDSYQRGYSDGYDEGYQQQATDASEPVAWRGFCSDGVEFETCKPHCEANPGYWQPLYAARQPVGEPVEKTDGEVAAQFFADHPALALRYWHEHIRRPLTHVPTTREASPYFECSAEQWERHTTGMTDGGKQRLANMVAHHCLLARRDDRGWIITRFDLIRSGKPWWHVSNDGVLTYDYDPATKERKVAAPTAQAVDLGRIRATVQALLNWIDDWAETPEESGIDAIEIEAAAVLDLIDSHSAGGQL
ncbi:hypothetical protein U4I65_02330 [Stenotrophomonas maltophilia]|uniref:hypothetical protein n=1 Tax=Stenotrophomonas maltophilia TaxID=40324 RepID=UPI002ACD02E2|nr:hypothetical protein [Stenotrophomonas maltophilia]MDZ5813873.1 hypothetical protein [Stenotrophomonas maltophilia]